MKTLTLLELVGRARTWRKARINLSNRYDEGFSVRAAEWEESDDEAALILRDLLDAADKEGLA